MHARRDIERVLLIGRSAATVAHECPVATSLLSPTPLAAAGGHDAYGAARRSASAGDAASASVLADELVGALDRVAAACFRRWADWAAAALSGVFMHMLVADGMLQVYLTLCAHPASSTRALRRPLGVSPLSNCPVPSCLCRECFPTHHVANRICVAPCGFPPLPSLRAYMRHAELNPHAAALR
jgi:hypothetical protein